MLAHIFNILELSGNGNMLQTILIQVDIVGVKRSMIVFLCKKKEMIGHEVVFEGLLRTRTQDTNT